MAIPSQKKLRRPILEIADGAKEDVLHKRDIVEKIIERFSLTNDDRRERTPQLGVKKLENRVDWTLSWLKKAGLLQSPSRGRFQITPRGKELLATGADYILSLGWNALDAELRGGSGADSSDAAANDVVTDSEDSTPYEQIPVLHKQLRDRLAEELLESVKRVSYADFERLVVRLLEKMGYGEGEPTGKSGDGGIDGIIEQDALGLEKVYIQAKLWEKGNRVGSPEIQKFSGSLNEKGARKGVFITSSSFTKKAHETADKIAVAGNLIRLIDGEELARLMIDHGVGVVIEITYDVKKLDENYFAEDR